MNLPIRYIKIEHGVLSDAPFVGSRIIGIRCSNGCVGCFNQHLMQEPYQTAEAEEIIAEVNAEGISQGIIFGGLEWTEQPEELQCLVEMALETGIQIMIYTHLDLFSFLRKFPMFFGKEIYLKCGAYIEEEKSYMDFDHDVYLASSNQKIYHLNKLPNTVQTMPEYLRPIKK